MKLGMIVLFYEISYASSDLASNPSVPSSLNSALKVFLKILLLLGFFFYLNKGTPHILLKDLTTSLQSLFA